MKATLAIFLSALSLATALPGTVLEERGEETNSTLAKRTNWAACYIANCYGDSNANADIHVDTWGNWDDDWGQGFLDNLRGQCGGIYGWTFTYDNNDPTLGGHAHFYANSVCQFNSCPNGGVCSNHCIENAIWLASSPTSAIGGVDCSASG